MILPSYEEFERASRDWPVVPVFRRDPGRPRDSGVGLPAAGLGTLCGPAREHGRRRDLGPLLDDRAQSQPGVLSGRRRGAPDRSRSRIRDRRSGTGFRQVLAGGAARRGSRSASVRAPDRFVPRVAASGRRRGRVLLLRPRAEIRAASGDRRERPRAAREPLRLLRAPPASSTISSTR